MSHTGFLDSLFKRLSGVRSKRNGLAVCLYGEPGIGKSYTAQELLRVLPCQSLSLPATVSSHQLALALPEPKRLPAWAQTQLELLRRGEPITRQGLTELVVVTLEKLAPFVLHLEDAHECSQAQLEELLRLAQSMSRTRGLALLVASRAPLPKPFVSLCVPELEAAEVEQILQGKLGAAMPKAALEYIGVRAAGNPLFTLEFLRFLTRQGFLWSDGQSWYWRSPASHFVPVTVEALLEQWLSTTVPNPLAQSVLEARACLPDTLSPTVLTEAWAQTADVTAATLAAHLEGLGRAGVLIAQRFAHPLIRETLLKGLPIPIRHEYARRALVALEAVDPSLALMVLEQAGLTSLETQRCLERLQLQASQRNDARLMALVQAQLLRLQPANGRGQDILLAAQALEAFDYQAAVELVEFAWRAQPQHLHVVLALVDFRFDQERTAEMVSLLDGLPPDVQDQAEVMGWRLVTMDAQGKRSQALELWQAHPNWKAEVSARLLSLIARMCFRDGQAELMREILESGLQRPDLSTHERCLLLNVQAMLFSTIENRYPKAIAVLSRVLELEPQHGAAWLNRAIMKQNSADFQGAKHDYLQAIAVCSARGKVILAAKARVYLAGIERRQGNMSAAETLLLESQTAFERCDSRDGLFECWLELSTFYRKQESPIAKFTALKYAKLAVQQALEINMAQYHKHNAFYNATKAALLCDDALGAAEYLRLMKANLETTENGLQAAQYHDLLGEAAEQSGKINESIGYHEAARQIFIARQEEVNAKIQEYEIWRLKNDTPGIEACLGWAKEHDVTYVVDHISAFLGSQSAVETRKTSSSGGMVFNLLGTPQIIKDGKPITYKARKRLELLIYLLEARVAGRSEATTLELLDALYPEFSEAEAKGALKQSVYMLRSKLGAEVVISTTRGYTLGAVDSDLEQLVKLPDSALWRGPYLSGFGSGFFEAVRGALIQSLMDTAHSLLEADPKEASRLAAILLEMEPYDRAVLQLALQAQRHQPHIADGLYKRARQHWLEVGEKLPADWQDFLQVGAVAARSTPSVAAMHR